MKTVNKLILTMLCLTALICAAHAQESHSNKPFKELLAGVNANFTFPDGFAEVLPLNNEKTSYQYAMELPGSDFEVRIQVSETKREWKKYEKAKEPEKVNPDSLYSKVAATLVNSMATDGRKFNRAIPAKVLQFYNADIGQSYFFSLTDSPVTKHYQYALLVIIQKNHFGSIAVTCFGNDRGPEFFKKINMLKNCLKFNN
ncbi:hypothetical protein KXQ82_00475 [Mucilaginibacter sp. HMF5004]|uniref:hypothetical protein n=1 Tax=Mucilaginibacter rivuli TaxID=2857527 RepID=UPI001C5E07CD|nr:hypothetical protein [Mucilaginibacter rivuli]MBW4888161.1 hypothetical protein [Mucilaginibacter rivuli]